MNGKVMNRRTMTQWAMLCLGLGLLAGTRLHAQHGHLNAGAASWDQNSKLQWDNGAAFVAASGYVKSMVYSNMGTFASTFNGNISLTALHSTNGLGERINGSTAPGSFIVAEIVSVRGPEGGSFTFWHENEPHLVVPSGTTDGGFRYELSDATLGAGQPGVDPFGHLHGRRFSLNQPGIYEIGFRAIDISTNGTGGGPIHTPSDVLRVMFQAGINLESVEPAGDRTHIRFGSMVNFLWQLESIDSLSATDWRPVGDPIAGADRFMEIEDERPAVPTRFYRMKGELVVP